MRRSRVGCLSLGIDSPPFCGPPLCPSDPVLSPTTPVVCRCLWDMSMTCREIYFGEVVGSRCGAPKPHNPFGRGRGKLKPLPTSFMFSEPVIFFFRLHGAPIGRFWDGRGRLLRSLLFWLGFSFWWFFFCLFLKPFIAFLF